jgi:hypothetical protein
VGHNIIKIDTKEKKWRVEKMRKRVSFYKREGMYPSSVFL